MVPPLGGVLSREEGLDRQCLKDVAGIQNPGARKAKCPAVQGTIIQYKLFCSKW